MKSARILTITILLLVGATVYVHAEERSFAKATVPFAFTAENVNLPAGTYLVSTLSPYQMIKIQRAGGHEVAMVPASSNERTVRAGQSKLVFDHIGDQYFLRQVFEQGSRVRRDVNQGKLAHELVAQGHAATHATVIAGNGK
jgi:hypothetical protein